MATVRFTDCTGVLHIIEAKNGWSLMEVAVDNDIVGIAADCGGACTCGTCHAYIDESWLKKLPEVGDREDNILEGIYERKDNSRLTCQIVMTDELDGIELEADDND